MSVLQIDAINTVIRSHYMPLFSRLGHYDRALLDQKLFDARAQRPTQRRFYEYWGHECSVLPIELYPLFDWRRADACHGKGIYRQIHQLAMDNADLVKRIKQEVRQRGPVACSDLEKDARGPGMWEWSSTKTALEYLFWTGELASAGRRSFQRLYALPESAIPAEQLNSGQRHRLDDQMALTELAAGALGVATESDLRDYFRLPAADSKTVVSSLVEDKRLLPVSVQNWRQTAYVLPDVVVPRKIQAGTLLTPFDPIVWCRDRALRLFDFHYRIEIYVPAAKRQFGYWVMPFLFNDRLVARLDLKADREADLLIVKGAWLQQGVNADEVIHAIHNALSHLAMWLGLNDVVIKRKGDLARYLHAVSV